MGHSHASCDHSNDHVLICILLFKRTSNAHFLSHLFFRASIPFVVKVFNRAFSYSNLDNWRFDVLGWQDKVVLTYFGSYFDIMCHYTLISLVCIFDKTIIYAFIS